MKKGFKRRTVVVMRDRDRRRNGGIDWGRWWIVAATPASTVFGREVNPDYS